MFQKLGKSVIHRIYEKLTNLYSILINNIGICFGWLVYQQYSLKRSHTL